MPRRAIGAVRGTAGETGGSPFDGVSLGVRYRSPDELYYVNVHRRDGQIAIKKKSIVDGSAAYVTLAAGTRPVPYDAWDDVAVTVRDVGARVRLTLSFGGHDVLSAVDDGTKGGAPLRRPGRVLVRGDNCQFSFNDLEVEPVASANL